MQTENDIFSIGFKPCVLLFSSYRKINNNYNSKDNTYKHRESKILNARINRELFLQFFFPRQIYAFARSISYGICSHSLQLLTTSVFLRLS
jgi:hypothetical protein